jgi:hypothetical protein
MPRAERPFVSWGGKATACLLKSWLPIAALDDAAVTIDFRRAITRPRLGVDLIVIAGDH